MVTPVSFRLDATQVTACRDTLRGGSRSFFAASHLLPRRYAVPATVLYAYCRLADDVIDEGADDPLALARLHASLDRVYAGAPGDCPVEQSFTELVAAFGIPRVLPEALFEGFEWDTRLRRYDSLGDVFAYGTRVAGTVGAMMALVMGVRSPLALARAIDLGVAMQLSNIARDVGEDARNGRLYLPRDWFAEAGIDADAWLQAPSADLRLVPMVHRLLDAASELYGRAESGIALLPAPCRPGIFAARLLYAEIGEAVRELGEGFIDQRAVVPGQRKAALLCRAIGRAAQPRAVDESAVLAQAAYLLDAVALTAPRSPATQDDAGLAGRIDRNCEFLFDLFTRLEARERGLLPGAPPLSGQTDSPAG